MLPVSDLEKIMHIPKSNAGLSAANMLLAAY